jgi:NADP-dependent 3-hydroxy acid dehydrogenase YdfG
MSQCVLITGATGGIGGALAQAYAAPGVTLILQGRKADRLGELAGQCESLGARVLTQVLDVRDRVALTTWLHAVSETLAPDLVIVNAGVNTNIGPDGRGEPWDEVEALIQVNVLAAMATVDAVLPAMRSRGHGQIALISSLAAWFGLPVTPSYCASKAAVKAYGEALRIRLFCVRAGDVAILLSYSGGTAEVVDLAAILRTDGVARIGLHDRNRLHRSGEAQHAANTVELHRLVEQGVGQMFGPKRITGHQNGGSDVAGEGGVMGRGGFPKSHYRSPFS